MGMILSFLISVFLIMIDRKKGFYKERKGLKWKNKNPQGIFKGCEPLTC